MSSRVRGKPRGIVYSSMYSGRTSIGKAHVNKCPNGILEVLYRKVTGVLRHPATFRSPSDVVQSLTVSSIPDTRHFFFKLISEREDEKTVLVCDCTYPMRGSRLRAAEFGSPGSIARLTK